MSEVSPSRRFCIPQHEDDGRPYYQALPALRIPPDDTQVRICLRQFTSPLRSLSAPRELSEFGRHIGVARGLELGGLPSYHPPYKRQIFRTTNSGSSYVGPNGFANSSGDTLTAWIMSFSEAPWFIKSRVWLTMVSSTVATSFSTCLMRSSGNG